MNPNLFHVRMASACIQRWVLTKAGRYCNFRARIEKLLFIAVFTKTCGLTVLLGCFDLFH